MGNFLKSFSRSLIRGIAIFFCVASISFVLLSLYPGSPWSGEENLDPSVRARLNERYQLDQSWLTRYSFFIKNISTGNLGESLNHPGRTVLSVILEGSASSFGLGASSLAFSIFGALLFVFFTWSFRKGRLVFEILSLSIASTPTLLMAPLMVLIFSVWLDWFPVALGESWKSYILPVFVLSLRPMINLARILDKSMQKQSRSLQSQYARAMGFGEGTILFRNIFRPSLNAILAYLGPLSAGLLSGSLLIEMVFALPGLGSEYLNALVDRDFPLVIGLSLFYATLLILANSITSLLIEKLDPRLIEKKAG